MHHVLAVTVAVLFVPLMIWTCCGVGGARAHLTATYAPKTVAKTANRPEITTITTWTPAERAFPVSLLFAGTEIGVTPVDERATILEGFAVETFAGMFVDSVVGFVGFWVGGCFVGACVGYTVCCIMLLNVGSVTRSFVAGFVGEIVVLSVFIFVGEIVGLFVGLSVGIFVGEIVGL